VHGIDGSGDTELRREMASFNMDGSEEWSAAVSFVDGSVCRYRSISDARVSTSQTGPQLVRTDWSSPVRGLGILGSAIY